MIVYADVLILVNFIVNYFILRLTARLNKTLYKRYRIILASLLGGLVSLYIFLPSQPIVLETIFRLLTAAVIIFTAFGYRNLRTYLRNLFVMFITTFLYAGVMMGVWLLFKTNKIVINNSVVYFDVSAIQLIIVFIITYTVVTVAEFFLHRNTVKAEKCSVSVYINGRTLTLTAIFDTGNSVIDLFTDADTVIVDKAVFETFFDISTLAQKYASRYRIIPCSTVAGQKLLEGLRCDSMQIIFKGKKYFFEKPLVLASAEPIKDDFNAILNSDILLKLE